MRRRDEQHRLESLGTLLAALGLVVFARLAWVQVWQAPRYDNPTGINYHRRYALPAQKGDLVDREGRPLATCARVASIAANPQLLLDPAAAAALLAPLLASEPAELEAILRRRWRRQMLRRDVSPALEERLRPLVEQGCVSFSDEPGEATYSLYVFPQQFQPSPDERRELAIILATSPGELEKLLASEAGAVLYRDRLEATTAQRIEQLRLPGLLIQQNPARSVRAVWLEPTPATIIEMPVDPQRPGSRGIDWYPVISQDVWRALEPLWEGVHPPDKAVVEARLRAPFVYLAREVELTVGEAVEKLVTDQPALTGVFVHQEYRRENPQGELARTLLGRCDVDERGVSGLEALYQQILSGVDGYRRVTVAANGRPIIQEREELVPPVHGKTVELTLDAVIQQYAEEALAQALDKHDADWALAVILDPFTGQVLALADRANTARGVPAIGRTMATAFEPGSVIKPLVIAAALQAGLTTPNERFHCPGFVEVAGRRLRCTKAHGDLTTADGIRDSCNKVAVSLGQRLGQPGLQKLFDRVGLLQRTGLGLAGQEAIGAIFVTRADGVWGQLKTATVSYGKGIQCSAVGLARAEAALVNGGRLPQLHLVHRIREKDGGLLVAQETSPGPQVFDAATARTVAGMMRRVVSEPKGTGYSVRSELYDLLGKTGTSIAYGPRGDRVVSFLGAAPAERPRLLVLVSAANPRIGLRYGSDTCGPAVRQILEKSLQYLGVAPKAPAKAGDS